MTSEQKKRKIEILEEEILRINKKLGALLIQKGRLQDRLDEIKQIDPKDPKVLTKVEKEEQSQKDKEKYLKELLETLENSQLPEDEMSQIRSSVPKLAL